jgi:YesN/AraC family two-component response regulator
VQTQLPSCRVLKARNGRDALEIIRRQRPDLVLLDLMMPEMDGFGVLEAMREGATTCNIPVIVLTGQELTEADMERLNRGVAVVLGKGVFSIEETLEHIERALARRQKLGSETQRLVRRAMAYIHEHCGTKISRREIARHVGVSERHLQRCFDQELGMPPAVYLNRYRINRARILLEQGDKTVTQVALEVGFSASNYFAKVFRREVGVAPGDYRRGKRPSASR